MIEININKVKKSFGFDIVLNEVSFDINKEDRIALIGTNGSGKSTLLKIVAGEEEPDSGSVFIKNGSRVGFLKQIPDLEEDNVTVNDILYRNFKKITDIENKLREYEEKMISTSGNKLDILLKKYGKLQEDFYNLGGYEISLKINKLVGDFKLDKILDSKFNSLSGGEKRIVSLASIMINNPDILLLDEPTNHLDIDKLEWLEDYLNNYKGTILIVSHDRYFLDRVVTKIVLLEKGKPEIFYGNYSYYLKENEKRILLEFENYKNQVKMIEEMKKKIKQLKEFGRLAYPGGEPFFKRAASIQKRLDKIELLDKPGVKKALPLTFQFNNRSGKDALVLKNYSLSIQNSLLLKDIDLTITYGEKVCLIGKNGTGKTTFIKDIINVYNNINNEVIKIGSNVKIGYIPQEIVFVNKNKTVLDLARENFNEEESLLRASLAKFMFYGENVFKKVEALSGGEKIRLKLFELINSEANFLILDEPTNHIDIDTKEILEEALNSYKGTLLFVSHDRYFINKIASKIISIEDKKIVEYIGNYDDYKERKRDIQNN